MAHKLTTCTFCGVGCGIYLETAGNRITGAYPSMSHPTNQGRICVRGWNVHEVASSPDRLKQPLLRKAGGFQETTWSEALGFIAGRLREIRDQHGPDALGFLNSPRCSNEESYLLQKLARSVVGTNNVDHGQGVYCNNSLDVLMDMLGVPATTNAIGELTQCEVIVVDGVDLGRQLPTIGGRVIQAHLQGTRLIVIDSRRHRVAESADIFLQIRPGSEVVLYGAMAKVILDRGLIAAEFIQAHCREFDAFQARARHYDLLAASVICGVDPGAIEAAALAYARAPKAAWLYSTGIETRSTESVQAIVNLVLLTGHLGKPAAGLFALTEHNNLQGVCDMGMLPDRLPGCQPLSDPAARRTLESLWKTPLPATPGLGSRRLLDETHNHGQIKGLWLGRYDPAATSFFSHAPTALKQLELVVVQHLFMTATAQYADVILPLVAFGEEQVTFTSTDRRIQLAEQAADPPPGPMPAWQQITQVAQRMGADWHYTSAAQVMDEIGQAIPNYSGAHYENLDRDYGRQWPCTKDKPLGTRFLFEDGIPDRPFRFRPVAKPVEAPVAPAAHPLTLVFGNSLYYWHQNILIKHSETLKREYRILLLDYPNGFVEINDLDARRLNLRDGAAIRVVGQQGVAMTVARVTPEVKVGTAFVPYFVREVEEQLLGEAAGRHPRLPIFVRIEKA